MFNFIPFDMVNLLQYVEGVCTRKFHGFKVEDSFQLHHLIEWSLPANTLIMLSIVTYLKKFVRKCIFSRLQRCEQLKIECEWTKNNLPRARINNSFLEGASPLTLCCMMSASQVSVKLFHMLNQRKKKLN